MDIWKSMAGMVQLEIVSADPAALLQKIIKADIELFDVSQTGYLSMEVCIYRKSLSVVRSIAEKVGAEVRIKRRSGVYWIGKAYLKRPMLFIGIAFLLILGIILPSRVLFVRVEGNVHLPARLILEKAEECGISFGTDRGVVRSEKMKNALISAIPELQWAGINTSGCVATISVREKEQTDTDANTVDGVNSIVAARDGVIVSYTVLKGNALCRVGQAVKAGQTLVSGYTDCGIKIQATRSEAEILARTFRTLQTISPISRVVRGDNTSQETKYSLKIGKKLINFYKNSGISDTTCVKMYKEDYITLPGGFDLPVALVTEQWVYYETEAIPVSQKESYSWMDEFSQRYLQNQMIAGQILTEDHSLQILNGVCSLNGEYSCLEMIGHVKNEENLHDYGENYGENR